MSKTDNYCWRSIVCIGLCFFINIAYGDIKGLNTTNPLNDSQKLTETSINNEDIQFDSGDTYGIYVNWSSSHNKNKVNDFINLANKSIINTFVVDLPQTITKNYQENVKNILENNIKYIPRVVVFPYGATKQQAEDPSYWQRHLPNVKKAIEMGAEVIQLDYIRYAYGGEPNPEKSKKILSIIQWYKNQVHQLGAKLEIAVFGISAFHPSIVIGQDIKLFSESIDAVIPMLYPSHFEPYKKHAKNPKSIVRQALQKAMDKIEEGTELRPFLETFNYRFEMNREQRIQYTTEQILASEEIDTNGWYFWSAGNHYEILFETLETLQ